LQLGDNLLALARRYHQVTVRMASMSVIAFSARLRSPSFSAWSA
jgi:hypothetical protein